MVSNASFPKPMVSITIGNFSWFIIICKLIVANIKRSNFLNSPKLAEY